MEQNYCRICRVEDGFFVDIFGTSSNSYVQDIIRASLTIKITQVDDFSTKICHKCNCKLKLCREFIEQIHSCHLQVKCDNLTQDICFICRQSGNFILLSSIENWSRNWIFKLEALPFQFVADNTSKKICHNCIFRLNTLVELRELAIISESKLRMKKQKKSKEVSSELQTERLTRQKNAEQTSSKLLNVKHSKKNARGDNLEISKSDSKCEVLKSSSTNTIDEEQLPVKQNFTKLLESVSLPFVRLVPLNIDNVKVSSDFQYGDNMETLNSDGKLQERRSGVTLKDSKLVKTDSGMCLPYLRRTSRNVAEKQVVTDKVLDVTRSDPTKEIACDTSLDRKIKKKSMQIKKESLMSKDLNNMQRNSHNLENARNSLDVGTVANCGTCPNGNKVDEETYFNLGKSNERQKDIGKVSNSQNLGTFLPDSRAHVMQSQSENTKMLPKVCRVHLVDVKKQLEGINIYSDCIIPGNVSGLESTSVRRKRETDRPQEKDKLMFGKKLKLDVHDVTVCEKKKPSTITANKKAIDADCISIQVIQKRDPEIAATNSHTNLSNSSNSATNQTKQKKSYRISTNKSLKKKVVGHLGRSKQNKVSKHRVILSRGKSTKPQVLPNVYMTESSQSNSEEILKVGRGIQLRQNDASPKQTVESIDVTNEKAIPKTRKNTRHPLSTYGEINKSSYKCEKCKMMFHSNADGKVHELTHTNRILKVVLERCVPSAVLTSAIPKIKIETQNHDLQRLVWIPADIVQDNLKLQDCTVTTQQSNSGGIDFKCDVASNNGTAMVVTTLPVIGNTEVISEKNQSNEDQSRTPEQHDDCSSLSEIAVQHKRHQNECDPSDHASNDQHNTFHKYANEELVENLSIENNHTVKKVEVTGQSITEISVDFIKETNENTSVTDKKSEAVAQGQSTQTNEQRLFCGRTETSSTKDKSTLPVECVVPTSNNYNVKSCEHTADMKEQSSEDSPPSRSSVKSVEITYESCHVTAVGDGSTETSTTSVKERAVVLTSHPIEMDVHKVNTTELNTGEPGNENTCGKEETSKPCNSGSEHESKNEFLNSSEISEEKIADFQCAMDVIPSTTDTGLKQDDIQDKEHSNVSSETMVVEKQDDIQDKEHSNVSSETMVVEKLMQKIFGEDSSEHHEKSNDKITEECSLSAIIETLSEECELPKVKKDKKISNNEDDVPFSNENNKNTTEVSYDVSNSTEDSNIITSVQVGDDSTVANGKTCTVNVQESSTLPEVRNDDLLEDISCRQRKCLKDGNLEIDVNLEMKKELKISKHGEQMCSDSVNTADTFTSEVCKESEQTSKSAELNLDDFQESQSLCSNEAGGKGTENTQIIDYSGGDGSQKVDSEREFSRNSDSVECTTSTCADASQNTESI